MHRVRIVSVDGNRIGRTWQEHFFQFAANADAKEKELREFHNPHQVPEFGTVGNLSGFIWWQYGIMLVRDVIECEDCKS